MIFIGIYIILTLSLNLLNGYVGLLSIGHAAFYGIGAYASAKLVMEVGLPFPWPCWAPEPWPAFAAT
jgi:branched-chain amino acid transport system permease protein